MERAPGDPRATRFDPDLARWIDLVVTNGPAIELRVGYALPCEELLLAAPGEERVSGRVRFDPDRDAVVALELVRGGTVIERVDAPATAAGISLETVLEIDRTAWLALRAVLS